MGIVAVARKTGGGSVVGTLVCGDSGTTAVRVIVPRRSGGVDLAELNWSVGVRNASGEERVAYITEVEAGESAIAFDWYPDALAAAAVGDTFFDVVGADAGQRVWSSAPYILRIVDSLGIERAIVDVTRAICGEILCGETICGKE